MPEHTLILLRHAKSDWSGDEPDKHRPLAKRGHRQAPEAGQWLAANVDRIDLAVVSPAIRARTTWELASAELGSSPETRGDDRVYAASCGELLDVVRHSTTARHGGPGRPQPGLEDLVEQLTGVWVSMVTSALAVVELPGSWAGARRAPGPLCGPRAGPLPDADYCRGHGSEPDRRGAGDPRLGPHLRHQRDHAARADACSSASAATSAASPSRSCGRCRTRRSSPGSSGSRRPRSTAGWGSAR